MGNFEDYYEILQVSSSAEPEVIEAAYRKLAQKYHPDLNKSPDAAQKMQRINIAHDILGNYEKRKIYHAEWLNRKGNVKNSAQSKSISPPRPVIDPPHIKFKNIKPGIIKRASFLVVNTGGSYSKIWVDNPNSWVRITSWHSLSPSDELPLKVYLEAQGKDWSKIYSENIKIRLDSVEAQVRVEFHTQLLIKDHGWRDIDHDDLKVWVKKRKDRLDAGEELRGKFFRYRLNRNTGRYQFRLRHSYDKAVYDPLH